MNDLLGKKILPFARGKIPFDKKHKTTHKNQCVGLSLNILTSLHCLWLSIGSCWRRKSLKQLTNIYFLKTNFLKQMLTVVFNKV